MSEMHEAKPVSRSLISSGSSIRARRQPCCRSTRKLFNGSPARARYALCGSENYGVSAHPISTRGYICG